MKLKTVLLIALTLFFIGCGYKPTAHYAKSQINDNIFVALDVNLVDPKNAVILKDSVNELLINKLGKRIVDKKAKADAVMNLQYKKIKLAELSYDASGYISLYRVTTDIGVQYTNKGEATQNFDLSSSYEFSVESSGTLSDANRFDAIKEATNKALDELISRIAIKSFKK